MAIKKDIENELRETSTFNHAVFWQARHEFATRRYDPVLPDVVEEDADAAGAIQDEYARAVSAVRQLPSWQRAAALRAAAECRRIALKALRERRAWRRHGQMQHWLLSRPAPGR